MQKPKQFALPDADIVKKAHLPVLALGHRILDESMTSE